MITTMKKLKCFKCLYEWLSRVKEPKECPACKSRQWKAQGKLKRVRGGKVVLP